MAADPLVLVEREVDSRFMYNRYCDDDGRDWRMSNKLKAQNHRKVDLRECCAIRFAHAIRLAAFRTTRLNSQSLAHITNPDTMYFRWSLPLTSYRLLFGSDLRMKR